MGLGTPYVTLGATAAFSRYSVGAAYRNGPIVGTVRAVQLQHGCKLLGSLERGTGRMGTGNREPKLSIGMGEDPSLRSG